MRVGLLKQVIKSVMIRHELKREGGQKGGSNEKIMVMAARDTTKTETSCF
jgi:hypothetical protein